MDPMPASSVAAHLDATVRIYCPQQRRCLWAAHDLPDSGPDHPDDPAEALYVQAGCRADPPTCPCAVGDGDEQQQVVKQVAVAALSATGLRAALAAELASDGADAADAAGEGPRLRTLAAADTVTPERPDTPLAAARPVIGLAGATLASLAGDLIASATLVQAQRAETHPDDGPDRDDA